MPKLFASRSIVVDAPIDDVYSHVRDFHQWPKWSPWLILERECKLDFAADGRSYSWNGAVIGSGNIAVADEKKNVWIEHRLTFLKPWKSTADVRFTFEQQSAGVKVTWSMDSSLPIFLFFLKNMMNSLIGMDYDRGLRMLKEQIETGSVASKVDILGSESFSGIQYVGRWTTCTMAEMPTSMASDLGKLKSWFRDSGTEPAGKAFSQYHEFDMVKQTVVYTIGYPVSRPANPGADFVTGEIPACKVFKVQHTGPYHHLGNGWSAGKTREQGKVFKPNSAIHPFEIYETEPGEVDEKDLVTVIHFPAK
jgi:effector-binding domain-containing protein